MNDVNVNVIKVRIEKILFIVITVAVLLFSVYRLFGNGAGFSTCVFTFIIPFIPVQALIFTVAGIYVASKKDKSKKDYVYFIIMCVTMLLYVFTFAASDKDLSSLAKTPQYDYIYFPAYVVNIIVSIISMIKH